ncbi:hypothetical protein L914_07237 [Phytophthora nicotianae]|uniref:Uncharacterized protein n=1 Tax=Phytophthora nicotianae TaxID=4792 RepID=W2J5Z0_PHYNI|nr:hypothetical protein L916_07290 [Phytophthora nicotianae]ETM48186.1 hypothetical protein L914_07237 [Phytophthora nicotianae]
MSATTKNMRTHLSSCDAVPSPLGPLMIGETLEYEEEERRASGTQTLITQLNAKVYPRRSREEREALDLKFAATKLGRPSAPSMAKLFFDLINNQWPPPSLSMLSTTLLGECYCSSMAQMAKALIKAPSVTLGVDGATNVLSRSMSNVIAHDPRPWFVEYLLAHLRKDSAPEVFKKIEATISRIHAYHQKEVVFGLFPTVAISCDPFECC